MTGKLDAKQIAASLDALSAVVAEQWKVVTELLQASNGLPKLPVVVNRAAIDPIVDLVAELEVIAFSLEEQVLRMKIAIATSRVNGIQENEKQDELLMELYAKFENSKRAKDKIRKELTKVLPLFQIYDISGRLMERPDIVEKLAPLFECNTQLKKQNEKLQTQLRNQHEFYYWLAMSNADLAS